MDGGSGGGHVHTQTHTHTHTHTHTQTHIGHDLRHGSSRTPPPSRTTSTKPDTNSAPDTTTEYPAAAPSHTQKRSRARRQATLASIITRGEKNPQTGQYRGRKKTTDTIPENHYRRDMMFTHKKKTHRQKKRKPRNNASV